MPSAPGASDPGAAPSPRSRQRGAPRAAKQAPSAAPRKEGRNGSGPEEETLLGSEVKACLPLTQPEVATEKSPLCACARQATPPGLSVPANRKAVFDSRDTLFATLEIPPT